jgi:NAD(P)-dependent dehydrogenase (short-subunit alcohol dehydrogenase family)
MNEGPTALPGAGERTLAGSVALITGAASGIGRATALVLASHGAASALTDLSAESLRPVVEAARAQSGEADAFPCDLTNAESVVSLAGRALDRFGRLDILINAAGAADTSNVLNGTLDAWDRTYRVNVVAPFLLIQAVARHMITRGGGGRIVNVSSSSAYRPQAGAAYAASKAALSTLTRVAAGDLAPHGINVNAIAPGLTRTAMVTSVLDDAAINEAVSRGPMGNLFKRVSEPEDIAAAILFLCLPATRQITAQTLHVSAGLVS